MFVSMDDLWSFMDIFGTIHCVYIDLEHSKRPTVVTELLFCKYQGFFPLHRLSPYVAKNDLNKSKIPNSIKLINTTLVFFIYPPLLQCIHFIMGV